MPRQRDKKTKQVTAEAKVGDGLGRVGRLRRESESCKVRYPTLAGQV
jgi:hypothetical protein